MQIDFDPGPPLWPYQIYVDRNCRSVSIGRRYVSSKATLEEAVAECQRITRDSLLALYAPHMSAAELNYAYLDSGVDPFSVGAPCVPFSAWAFARDCCCEITGEVIEHPVTAHPCDKSPPPRLICDTTAKPVIGGKNTLADIAHAGEGSAGTFAAPAVEGGFTRCYEIPCKVLMPSRQPRPDFLEELCGGDICWRWLRFGG